MFTSKEEFFKHNPERRVLNRVQGQIFTPEECDIIYNQFPKDPFHQATVFNIAMEGDKIVDVDEKYRPDMSKRTETIVDLGDTHSNSYFGDTLITGRDFLKSKLDHWICGNFDQWAKVIRYETGDFLRNHIDSGDTKILKKRQWTLIIQLSDESDYTGGDVVIGDWIIPKQKGFVCLFNGGHVPHEITEVTSGERRSFITWLSEKDLTFL